MGEDDIGKDSGDKDLGKSKDASDVTTDKMRDVTRDVTSLAAQAAKYDSLKAACIKQCGPMNTWMSLNDEETFNARTKALASGSKEDIQKAINNNVSGAKSVQALLPAISAKIAILDSKAGQATTLT